MMDGTGPAAHLKHTQSLAVAVFGDTARANLWLRRPLIELGRETPLVVAETEAGAKVIETILGKIAWGAAA